jgi:Schlafen, AlbA_2
MHQPPTYATTWKITCRSPEDAQALQQWLANHIGLDRVFTDTVRAAPNGVEQVETVQHRLGDYFADIRTLPESTANRSSLRLVFHRRPNAGQYWKDLMVSILQEIEAAPQKASIAVESKGEMETETSATRRLVTGKLQMAEFEQELQELIANRPRESLGLELKQWIDPSRPDGKAKIARGCIALRNNDGGRFVIGIKDDGTPDVGKAPPDVQASFHPDVIQGIVAKYSSDIFAVAVTFVEVSGQDYPVITVPAGVRTPVAAKADLKGDDGKLLVRDHTVYVRSLTSNNTVSSSEARRGDWESLTRICFNNREADIGAFVRRHLAALNFESLAALVPAFSSMLSRPTNRERIVEELNRGRGRFDSACRQRKLSVPEIGYRESVIVVDGNFPEQIPNAEFRDRLLRNAPSHTGWPPWVDLSPGSHSPDQPYVLDDGWQALIEGLSPATAVMGFHLDFWRIETRGVFYHIRGLEDDLNENRGMVPRQQLDFLLQIARTAEVISTGLSFARSLGCKDEETSLIFGFRWTKLQGRTLSSWADPRRFFRAVHVSHQDEFATPPIAVPLETPPTGIAPHVENAVNGLFTLFGGKQFSNKVIEDIVSDTLNQRM